MDTLLEADGRCFPLYRRSGKGYPASERSLPACFQVCIVSKAVLQTMMQSGLSIDPSA